jgi:O-antigen/teichoic acid export membrane protein
MFAPKKLSLPAKASFWYVVSNILQKGVSIIVIPIYTRLMSPEQYGVVSIFFSWYSIISIFTTLNMWNYVINNGMIKYAQDRDGFITSLLGLSSSITIAWFVIYLIFNVFWSRIFDISFGLMLIMFLELLFMPSFEYWNAKNRYDYHYKPIVISSLSISIAIPLASIPLIMSNENKAQAAITARVLVSVLVYLVPFILIIKKSRLFFKREYWKFALGFNLPLILHFVSTIVLGQSDRIMIGRIVSEDKAGIYSLAYSIASVISIFHRSINSSFVPWTYKKIHDNQRRDISRTANFLLLVMGGIIFLFILIAPELVSIIAPSEYHEAIYCIPPIASSVFFMFLFNLFANIEYYYEQTKFVMLASISGALLNIILNAICIPLFGYMAAAYTTLVCYVLFALGHYIFMKIVCRRFMPGKKIYNERFIFILSLLLIINSFAMAPLYDYWHIRYAFLMLAVVVIIKKRILIGEKIKILKG